MNFVQGFVTAALVLVPGILGAEEVQVKAKEANPAGLGFVELFNGKDLTNWADVNTSPETWSVKDGLLVCTGKPIGVMRSTKKYENFILVVEWRHMEAGGNSGVFLWSDAKPEGNRCPGEWRCRCSSCNGLISMPTEMGSRVTSAM